MGVPREQLHVAVRSLHVPVRALLGRRHSDWLDRLWGWSCLRRFSLRRLLALGRRWPRCRHTFRGFGLVLAAGRAASSLGGRLGHSSRRRCRRRLWGRLHRRWSRLRWSLCWRWLRWFRWLWFGHRVNILDLVLVLWLADHQHPGCRDLVWAIRSVQRVVRWPYTGY